MAPSAIIETPVAPEDIFKPSQHATAIKEPSPNVNFDPATHLDYQAPSRIVTMKDLAHEPTALSPVATTDPFPLLSHEGVLQHRRSLFSKAVVDNCLHQTRTTSCQLRGMAPRYAPFIHQFWHSPEVLKIVSDIAGVELIPAMDYEICHTNIQLPLGGPDAVRNTPIEPPAATEEAIQRLKEKEAEEKKVEEVEGVDKYDDSKNIIEWHKDSHPWVCVVMLSDARYMEGGETELMKGDGTTVKVRAPQMVSFTTVCRFFDASVSSNNSQGHAVLLQGRYILHTAAPVTNMPERITIVTSFRPKNPVLPDETTNANTRDKSHHSELYYQWTTYRLDVMAQRARLAAEALRERYEKTVRESDPEGKGGLCRVNTVDVEEVKQWSEEMMKYIQATMYEMRPMGE